MAGTDKSVREEITLLREKPEVFPEFPTLPDKLIVIGDSAMVMGFKLAGVVEAYIAEGKAAEKKLVELLDRENAGIIVVSESVVAGLDWRIKARIESIAKPIVVAVPDKAGPSAKAENLNEMIKRALGFDLGGK
ncbi:V-type ATP synthase subunit F [uncultured archaeon]|nr:V-type ATP synthase subunit F [uncultured archaeon]